ncbi:hypothetical protein EOE67_12225 [Rheinheimera riviphila]|uniref:Uncharacterized protein n=1 Tax=Rheinheimera riviphila TaxID=1834037 RepID=A0A437QRD1_9GAMM|nr:hypothetical protein [Rheinheimera riviphila]RVU37070.1 hypothetical protein EOE67_12225 [Rheinheimera riviphila]
MVNKIDKPSSVSPVRSSTGRAAKSQLAAPQPTVGSLELPTQWRLELAAIPPEQRLPWLAMRLTKHVLAEKFSLVDDTAPEYVRLSRRICQAILENPKEISRLQKLLQS